MTPSSEIKIVRQKAFLTQPEFTKELGVSFTTVNRWEIGKARPDLSAMKRVPNRRWNMLRRRERLYGIWKQWRFHSPANPAKSISIEAGELLECFVASWKRDETVYYGNGVY